MKKTLNKIVLIIFIGLTTLQAQAQDPTIRMRIDPANSSRVIVYLEWPGDPAYTNAEVFTPGRISVLYSSALGAPTLASVQGSWSLGQSAAETDIDGLVGGAANNPENLAYADYTIPTPINVGNVTTAGTTDDMFTLTFPNPATGLMARMLESVDGIGQGTVEVALTTAGLIPNLSYSPNLPVGGSRFFSTFNSDQNSPTIPLPVDLISFDVTAFNTHDAKLDWATASELNNSHFEVQRSFDGYNFTTIDEVKGNGTSHSLINYSYVDETIPTHQNIVYYRLNQVDYNGESELSDVRLVQFEGFSNAPLVVYPNPTKSETTILLGDNVSQGEYTITDLVGKQWMADIVRAGSKSIELDFTNLPSGVYIATLNTENDSKHVRIIKK